MSTSRTIGFEKKELQYKRVIIIGAGGTGCAVAGILSRAGLDLTIVDKDIINFSNLERQNLYYRDDLLKPKAKIAAKRLAGFSEINPMMLRLDKKNISRIIPCSTDLVIDCTDNMATRMLINDYCKKKGITWIHTAAIKGIGTVMMINAASKKRNNGQDTPCYNCIFEGKDGENACRTGVSSSIVSIVGATAADMALKYLVHSAAHKKMLRINLNDYTISSIKVKRNPECKSCNRYKLEDEYK
jgi:molybdopterin/thiamine biosynthesis adenylyltransferase